MLSEKEQSAYLGRLGLPRLRRADLSTLNELHIAHLMKVPFENLDIALGRPISLDKDAVLAKLLVERRGGFCYELNYAFALLLHSLGYEVSLLSARVFTGSGFGPNFDHMLLLVNAVDGQRIADVGFGDCFRVPLAINSEGVPELGVQYSVSCSEEGDYELKQKREGADWSPEYRFTLNSHRIEDFREMCWYQQTSPESNFTKKTVCSIATKTGRKTLSNRKWITTDSGERTERPVLSESDCAQLLKANFGIVFADDALLARLLKD